MKTGTMLALFAAAVLPFAAYAGSDLSKLSKMKNVGEWETTITYHSTRTDIPLEMQRPETATFKKCVTQEDLNKMSDFTPKGANGMSCTLIDKDLTGNTFSYAMKCTGARGEMLMTGSTVFDSKDASHTHVEMKGTMDNRPRKGVMDARSKRIGDCTPGSP